MITAIRNSDNKKVLGNVINKNASVSSPKLDYIKVDFLFNLLVIVEPCFASFCAEACKARFFCLNITGDN
ncbi:MAG: hypothetical protein Q7W45_10585, partial [Bacteroidota bacterium]|nr:hypothetical protein [Bacteroidota bacterium]MDP3146098.1 hypothetical protein [Bacteroidota bacterium]